MEKDIKISVIMPVYNSGKYLSTAVESILNQSFKDIELILVDDGSTDGSSEICDEYALKDNRVNVIHQKNGGICNARNTALKITKGEYIGFSDHDDEYLPGYLEHAYMEAIKENADLVKVGKKEFIIKGDNVQRTKFSNLPYHVYDENEIKQCFFDLVDSGELDCLWDGLFKKSVIDKYNLRLDESYKAGGEDIDFIQKYIRHTKIFVTINTIYYNHYIRRGISTSSKLNTLQKQTRERLLSEMFSSMKILDIDIKQHKLDYTYLLLRQYIASLCAFYSNKANKMSMDERKQAIKAVKRNVAYLDFCDKQNVFLMVKKSSKYGLLYFLFKYNLYGLIVLMYMKRNIQ